MAFDIPTFVVTGAFIMFLCGALLIFASFYYRDAPAALWWGVSQFLLAGGVLFSLAGGMSGADGETAAAFVLFLMCAAAQWHGTRLLTGSRPYLPLILVGPVVMAAVNFLPLGSALPAVRGMSAMILNIAYFGGAIYALLRPPAGTHRCLQAAGDPVWRQRRRAWTCALRRARHAPPAGCRRCSAFSARSTLNRRSSSLASTFFVFAALRERKEFDQREAAGTDMLTGLANRRQLLRSRRADACRRRRKARRSAWCFSTSTTSRRSTTTTATPTGDDVLRVFASVAQRLLRPSDILGRIGGEEFAAILHGSTQETAFIIAERIRRAFEANAEFLDGQPIRATLSAGVATAAAPVVLDELLKEADAALYRAKEKGRNRVEQSRAEEAPPATSHVPRVA